MVAKSPTRKPPAAPVNPRKMLAPPTNGKRGWGGAKHPPVPQDKLVKPEEVIALDDKEFGKY
jgi:hypothetical protein